MMTALYDRARRAYESHCTRNGLVYQEPADGVDVDGFYLLSNRNGVLHAFKLSQGRLRTVDVDSVPKATLKRAGHAQEGTGR